MEIAIRQNRLDFKEFRELDFGKSAIMFDTNMTRTERDVWLSEDVCDTEIPKFIDIEDVYYGIVLVDEYEYEEIVIAVDHAGNEYMFLQKGGGGYEKVN